MSVPQLNQLNSSCTVTTNDMSVDIKIEKVDIETALEYTEYGKFNLFLTLIAGLCLFGANAEMYSVSYVLPSAECDLNLDTYSKSILTSMSFVGLFVGSFVWGYLSDTRGRRKIIMICLLVSFLCTLSSAFAPDFWSFTFFRFLNGLFICGPSSVIFAYFGEFQNSKNRSRAIAWISVLIGLGLISLPSFAWILLSQQFSFRILTLNFLPWRAYILLFGLPSLVVFIGLLWIPESPKYLFHTGKKEESLDVLKKMYTVNTGNEMHSFPVKELDDKDLKIEAKEKNVFLEIWRQSSPLFKNPYYINTIIVCVIQMGNYATSSGIFMWYPDILNRLSNSNSSSITVCQALSNLQVEVSVKDCSGDIDVNVFKQNLLIGFTYLFGYALWGFIVNFLGNWMFLIVSLATSLIALVGICIATNHIVIDVFFILVLVMPGIAVAVVNAAIIDIFPTNFCAMAVCLSMMCARAGSILSSSLLGILLEYNCTLTFIIYSISTAVCVILSVLLPRNPKT